ncbi:unnamed protein product [Brassica oleracea]
MSIPTLKIPTSFSGVFSASSAVDLRSSYSTLNSDSSFDYTTLDRSASVFFLTLSQVITIDGNARFHFIVDHVISMLKILQRPTHLS